MKKKKFVSGPENHPKLKAFKDTDAGGDKALSAPIPKGKGGKVKPKPKAPVFRHPGNYHMGK